MKSHAMFSCLRLGVSGDDLLLPQSAIQGSDDAAVDIEPVLKIADRHSFRPHRGLK
jgi:hypothetical protein